MESYILQFSTCFLHFTMILFFVLMGHNGSQQEIDQINMTFFVKVVHLTIYEL